MNTPKSTAAFLSQYLHALGILQKVYRLKHDYSDALPHIYSSILIDPESRYIVHGFGVSSNSRSLAKLKSLSEAVERISLIHQKKNNKNILKSFNISDNITSSISAEKILFMPGGSSIPPHPGIGMGFGMNHTGTILRGIYELIERDACITTYLLKVPLPHINIKSILRTRPQFDKIVKRLEEKNIQIHVLDATHDLGIPIFITILVDNNSNKPTITAGSKAGFPIFESILNSIEEAIMVYSSFDEASKKNSLRSEHAHIQTSFQRSQFWSNQRRTSDLSFWLQNSKKKSIQKNKSLSEKKQITQVIDLLKQKKMTINYIDITPPYIKSIGFMVYKVVIPQLQEFYFDEMNKKISSSRIQSVSTFFGINTKYIVNQIPHPFV
ncbi:hypothetical protein COY16_05465 [Candidatus Roizmanbacteria bacterium CG_4_10_14_0_2_um_filter_39_13]|uniref:YcaO domain-containing protein n=1 Tax=Candidatus Roizmanbacteria bacterium CG_4_10_14_0_2_um_filter_39_13 TaxID=1974825 RepID=A0A2M7TW59_9BACT|nr:MAG: hypothetical protein COY16_05465 [Candidatus Roizmanbacteria bacterium CG_4_10_14_0_2_um_filter_39_13]